jgi:hypothetical protein
MKKKRKEKKKDLLGYLRNKEFTIGQRIFPTDKNGKQFYKMHFDFHD